MWEVSSGPEAKYLAEERETAMIEILVQQARASTDPQELASLSRSRVAGVLQAVAGNPYAPRAAIHYILCHGCTAATQLAAARNPRTTTPDLLQLALHGLNSTVGRAAAAALQLRGVAPFRHARAGSRP